MPVDILNIELHRIPTLRVDTSTVMLVLGASLVSGAAPLSLASIIRSPNKDIDP